MFPVESSQNHVFGLFQVNCMVTDLYSSFLAARHNMHFLLFCFLLLFVMSLFIDPLPLEGVANQ